MNEEAFVRYLTKLFPQSPDVSLGIGDDAAALDLALPGGTLLLAAADQVTLGIHFTADTPLEKAGAKLLKRNLSDIAAMGGLPTHALLTFAANPLSTERIRAFYEGVAHVAKLYDVSVIGGDISSLPEPGLTASLTIFGKVEPDRICLRSNARSGDLLFCTGEYGNSFASGWHLDFIPRLREGRFLSAQYTCAAMDVSDGLRKDASRFAAASGLALKPDLAKIPLRRGATLANALSDGEDYELLFAVPPKKEDELQRHWPFPGVKLTRIGTFVEGEAGTFLPPLPDTVTGYDHFHESNNT